MNVAKAEKINWMIYGETKALSLKYDNVLSIEEMGNQQPSLEQRKVQRLSREGVESQAIGDSKR